MTKAALIACAALLTSAAAPALAGGAPEQPVQRASTASTQRVVMLCQRDALTQAAFRREHGSRPVYVTADEVMRAHATGERWTAPRCMNAGEHQRLSRLLGSRAL